MTAAPTPLRIGVDGRVFEGPRTGVGRYVFELCRELDDLLPAHAELFVYARRAVELPPVSSRWHLRLEPTRAAARLPASVWLKTRAATLARGDALTAFWATASLLPSLSRRVRTVSTVYDLNYLVAPETMPRTTRLAYRAWFARDVRRADAVVAISHGTARRLRDRLGVVATAIVRPAVAAAFRRPSSDDARAARARLGVSSPYVLAVGTREPRKNLPLLVEAFADARAGGLPAETTLVLAGGPGWRERRLARAIGRLPANAVRALGYVSDAELAALYAGATVFVFPSRYEGYGIPVAEARAGGAVVVAADVPELREAGGEDVTYVPATAACLTAALLASARGELPRATPPSDDGWRSGARTMAALLTAAPDGVTRRAREDEAAPSPVPSR